MRAVRSNSSEEILKKFLNTVALIDERKSSHLWLEYHLEEGDQVLQVTELSPEAVVRGRLNSIFFNTLMTNLSPTR